MARLTNESRRRAVALYLKGYSVIQIRQRLNEENIVISRQALHKLIRKYRMGTLYQIRPRRGKITEEMKSLIDETLRNNDEVTSTGLKSLLTARWPELRVSISTIKRVRKDMGWVCTTPHYCQLLRPLNKRKRLMWCEEQLRTKDDFSNVIFTDESTVQLEQHSKICFRKRLQPRNLKQRAKHPVKIHIWGGISVRGATRIIMFSGIMNARRLAMILEAGLLPFIAEKFSDGHRLFHDNDPKHASDYIENFFERNDVDWWPTPPESPDLNPIENIWGSLKQYLRTSYKPKNLQDLKDGIEQFWISLTPEVCQRYINHITEKVIPKIVSVKGDPSGY